MRADLARQWRVADLAAHACLSSSQFERVFKEHYGLSPMAYLTMLRVQEMARLLRTTDLLVEQICLRVGWHNRPHTARHFRRYYGVPPTVYRRQGPHTASLGGPGAAVVRCGTSRRGGGDGAAQFAPPFKLPSGVHRGRKICDPDHPVQRRRKISGPVTVREIFPHHPPCDSRR